MPERTADTEVNGIAGWLWEHMGEIKKGEREISYRELRRILPRFGYALEHPNNNAIELVKREIEVRGLFRKTEVVVEKRINSIPYPGDNRFVTLQVLKQVRRLCRLTADDGVDSLAFYDNEAVVDSFINQYRGVLNRLARR